MRGSLSRAAALAALSALMSATGPGSPGGGALIVKPAPSSHGEPGAPVPARVGASDLRRLFGLGGSFASSVRNNYIRRPRGSVARDKRAAKKRRNVVRARRAGR